MSGTNLGSSLKYHIDAHSWVWVWVCVHTWKSSIFKVSEFMLMFDVRSDRIASMPAITGFTFQVMLERFYTEISYEFDVNKLLKGKDNDLFPPRF